MYRKGRRNKYGNKKVVYAGVRYDSKMEAKYAYELDLRIMAKDIKSWERQIRISLEVQTELGKKKICVYVCDFEIIHNDGSKELVEVKGHETAVWKLKKKMLEILWLPKHKNYRFTVVK